MMVFIIVHHGIMAWEIIPFEFMEVAELGVSQAWVMFPVLTTLAQDALFDPKDSQVIEVISKAFIPVLNDRMDFVKAFVTHESRKERLYFITAGVMAQFKVSLVQPEVIEANIYFKEFISGSMVIEAFICFTEITDRFLVADPMMD